MKRQGGRVARSLSEGGKKTVKIRKEALESVIVDMEKCEKRKPGRISEASNNVGLLLRYGNSK